MLGWAVYVTNIPKTIMPPEIAYQLYAIRWKIEIIFKIWKSFFTIATTIPKASANYVQCIIYARLILIVLANHFYITVKNTVYQQSKRHLSPMKFAQFTRLFISPMWPKINPRKWKFTLYEFFDYYCLYEKRSKRQNIDELIAKIGTTFCPIPN